MSWIQIWDWAAQHAAVVSVGGVLTVFVSAYSGHLLTKSRENLKRRREHDSMRRKAMVDRCIDLLNVASEAKIWVYARREELARMADRVAVEESGRDTDTTAVKELRHAIYVEFIALGFRIENVGQVARQFCPSGSASYTTELSLKLFELLACTGEEVSKAQLSQAQTDVDAAIARMHVLIRSTYNTELYDNLDPRTLGKRFRYGFTETARRAYRERAASQILTEMERQSRLSPNTSQQDVAASASYPIG